MKLAWVVTLGLLSASCARSAANDGVSHAGAGGAVSDGLSEVPGGPPRFHPPAGFEDCKHAEVKADCKDGWCKLPPSCFVMGTPPETPGRGAFDEEQAAVTLTHSIEMQESEMTRGEFRSLIKENTPAAPGCDSDDCPAVFVNWWDAVQVANRASEKKGLKPCYEPVGCTGTLGKDLVCTGFKDPELSVYSCEGIDSRPERSTSTRRAREQSLLTTRGTDGDSTRPISVSSIRTSTK